MSAVEYIAGTTLTAASSSVSFTGVPAVYTDLVASVVTTVSGPDILLQFNSDTGANYSRTYIFGNGTSAGSGRNSSASSIALGAPGTLRMITVNVMGYANTNVFKTVPWLVGSAADDVAAAVGMWRSTSAITSLTFSGPTYPVGSTFSLWGVS